MANWSDLKAAVASIVKTNGNKEITGQLLQNVLNNIISNVGLNSSFAGIATPETNPGTPDGNVFYLATQEGTYPNFNGIVINSGEAVILEWKGSWVKKDSGFANDAKISLNAIKHANDEAQLQPSDFKLGKFSGSGEFELSDVNRMCLERVPLLELPFKLKLKDGYLFYYYLYDKNGTFLQRNEEGLKEVELGNENVGYISIAIKPSNNEGLNEVRPISLVIDSVSGISYPLGKRISELNLEDAKIKKAIETHESILKNKENLSGRLISVKNAIEGSNVLSSSSIIITGKNVLDSTTAKKNTIKNDSGVEVYDAVSAYYTHYIPVEPGMTLISAFTIERYYKYDNNKSFISRASSIQKGTPFTIPSGVYWIQIQTVEFENPRMIVYGSTLPEYEAFISNTEKKAYSTMNIYNEEGSVIDVKVNKYFDLKDLESKVTYLSDKSNVKDVIIEKKGEIVSITDDLVTKVNSIESNNGITMVGKNIFDSSTSKRNYIINDAGIEIYDGVSTYYQHYIPCHGKILLSNFKVQRYYLYGKDKNFLRRTDSFLPGKLYVVPNEAYFVRVQVEPTEYNLTNKMIIYNGVGDVNIYEPYKVLTELPNSAFNIYSDGATKISVLLNVTCMNYIPEVGEYEYWEPEEVTNDYSCPIGQGTQSVEGLTYELLLTNYFDIYINKKYSDGYTVTKKGLGNDSANNETNPLGNEVFMYDFKPKYFNHTVLISAGMNACELSGIFGLAYFIKALMEQQEEGMKALYNTTRFVVMPCICPSCLNSSPIKYTNFNEVRINKNFNYKGSWSKIKELYPYEPVGKYPDSEVETVMLKKWINDYPNADLWIDCHSDAGGRGYTNLMTQVICSDSSTVEYVRFYWSKMRQFYIDKGYITEQTEVSQQAWVEGGTGYPKTLYSKHICNTPAIMIEQYISSTTYGSDGETNNDSYGIKNYTSLLRAYTLAVCRSEAEIM